MEITERLKEIILQETNTDFTIKIRKRETIELRALYCNVLKQLKPNITLQSIGDTLELNHATIIHALNKYNEYEKYNKDLKRLKASVLSHFIKSNENIEELSLEEQMQQDIYNLTFENDTLRIQLNKQKEIKKYSYEIIENLNNLLDETFGTIQYDLIDERLKAFYRMNKNIKL
jgi:hypothetical protein